MAKTPTRVFPPSLGGRTVGFQFFFTFPVFSENSQIIHIREKPSSPRTASATRYSGSKMISAVVRARPLCLGIPNLVLKSVRILAIGFISMFSFLLFFLSPAQKLFCRRDSLCCLCCSLSLFLLFLIWQFHRQYQTGGGSASEEIFPMPHG